MINEIIRQVTTLSLEGEVPSLKSLASDAFLRNVLSTSDTDWAYRLGKNRNSELAVELMSSAVVRASCRSCGPHNTTLSVVLMFQAFLIGRAEYLHEPIPDKVIEIITPEIKTILSQIKSNHVPSSLSYLSLELHKDLPPILLLPVINALYSEPYEPGDLTETSYSQWYIYFIEKLLFDAVIRSDAERLSVLLTDKRFYSRSMPFGMLDLTSERAVACVEVMLASEKVNIDIVSVVREYFSDTSLTGPYKKIRELLLCDRRSKGREFTEFLVIDQTRLINLLMGPKARGPENVNWLLADLALRLVRSKGRDLSEFSNDQNHWTASLLDELARKPNELLKQVVTIWEFPEPIFNSIVERCLKHHELTANAVGDALYEVARRGQYGRLQLFLADKRVRVSTILRVHLGQGTFIPEPFRDIACYHRTRVILNAELIARTTRPIIIAIGATALLLICLIDQM